MKFVLVGDVHLADRPPSIRTETYTEDILAKLQFCADLVKERDADALVLAGDVFHIKTPTRNSHALVQRTGEVLRSCGAAVLITPGNHDLSNDRLDSLKKQPLGTLAKMEGIDLLIGPHRGGFPLFGVPYLYDWTELPKWMSKYKDWAAQQTHPLMVTHAPIFPAGEVPPYDYIAADDWADQMGKGDCVYGHIHDPHGVYQASPTVMMCNNGAISRGSLHEATLKRKPRVTIWEDGYWETVDVPHRPVEAVFKLAEKEDVDERTNRVEEFLSEVGSTRLNGLSLEEVRHQAQTRGLKPRTVELIHDLLEQV